MPLSDNIWRHVKSGKDYQILHVALMESNLRPLVVYRSWREAGPIWVRPVEEFLDGRFVMQQEIGDALE